MPTNADRFAATPLLELREVVAGWSQPVVGPVSMTLHAGEVVGLWGANGSGKSTLLAAIAGCSRRFAGEIHRAAGLRVAMQTQALERIAPLPVTGRELLAIAGADRPAYPPPATLARILNRRLDRISGGQHQLIAVWAALAGQANLILLDEPTNNLDPHHTDALAQMLLSDPENRAVLLVSHERAFLDAHCTRVLSLDRSALSESKATGADQRRGTPSS